MTALGAIKTLGFVGDGQLGRMLAGPAKQMGFRVLVLGSSKDSPAGQVADEVILGDFRNYADVLAFGEHADVVTFEIEDANEEALAALLTQGVEVHPSPKTLGHIKDKYHQKVLFSSQGVPVAPFAAIHDCAGILEAGKRLGFPLVLKARKGSYDGRRNAHISNRAGINDALDKLREYGELYVEAVVPFVRELSVVAARDVAGNIVTYSVVETYHDRDICSVVMAPAPISAELARKAQALAHRVLEVLEGVGVFGIEMFLTADDEVLVNEVAPRVHNSGHWTIEGAVTSQFEQHIRAITGLPLGSTAMKVPAAVMVNILGERGPVPAELSGMEKALAVPGVSVHIYGKDQTKPDRKMGHVTAVGENIAAALIAAQTARDRISI